MDKVIKIIQRILPLAPELLKSIEDKLVDLGVGDVSDLQHLQENDLTEILKPIQIRKLLQHLKQVCIQVYETWMYQ